MYNHVKSWKICDKYQPVIGGFSSLQSALEYNRKYFTDEDEIDEQRFQIEPDYYHEPYRDGTGEINGGCDLSNPFKYLVP